VYREDLDRNPHNIWATHGLLECLRASVSSSSNQGGETQIPNGAPTGLPTSTQEEVAELEAELKVLASAADVKVHASCFCSQAALSHMET